MSEPRRMVCPYCDSTEPPNHKAGCPMSDIICNDCKKFEPGQFLTEINPEGGYGRPQFLVCDDCMKSSRWDHWKADHWQNWPEEPRVNI